MFLSFRPGLASGLFFLLLAGCGGGSSGDAVILASGSQQNNPASSTLMSCIGGSIVQCTGDHILKSENGVSLTAYGVQAYGISTNDLQQPNPTPAQAYGLAPGSGGMAEVRVRRDGGSIVSVALLLSKMGLSWDGKNERPLAIETFETRAGRTELNGKGEITFSALPAPTDLDFYDYGKKGALGTQAHYANNTYFPRTEPVRCPSSNPDCPKVESNGLKIENGDWKTGGTLPDKLVASRLHSDGATQAGWGVDANGGLTLLPSADGPGVSYPGFKGFRNYQQWSYAYANVGGWITQDTVLINEWGGGNEHNKMRRGVVAFGTVTDPAKIPAAGKVTYSGALRGWFSYDSSQDSYPVFGDVQIEVDFSKRIASITISGTRLDEAGITDAVPVSLSASLPVGSGTYANTFTGPVDSGTLQGGLGARFFGPLVGSGSNSGPAEIGGSITMRNPVNGMMALASILLRKQ